MIPDRIRFHLDEHVDPAIAAGLQRYGIDVTTTVGASLRTQEDAVHLAFANAERRVIVTHDNDYLRFHAQALPHPRHGLSARDRPADRPDHCEASTTAGDHDPRGDAQSRGVSISLDRPPRLVARCQGSCTRRHRGSSQAVSSQDGRGMHDHQGVLVAVCGRAHGHRTPETTRRTMVPTPHVRHRSAGNGGRGGASPALRGATMATTLS